jgi:hypothetical protein
MRAFGLILGLCVICAAGAKAQDTKVSAQPPKWGASIDFEGKLGTERHLGEADLFLPLAQDDRTLFFGNARYRFDDNESKEGNFGLGLRHMHAGGWNTGVYGYYDRRQTETGNLFNQATFGVEALGTDFDARANSYWPIGETSREVDSLNSADLSGTSVTFRGGEEHAMAGFDAEIGWRVPVFEEESDYDLRIYGGGYHFYDEDDDAPDVTGPRLRAEFTAYDFADEVLEGSRLTLGAEWQDDDVRDSQGFISARLRIPLQSEEQRNRKLTAQERRMTTPIVRDIDIVAQAGAYGAPETATQLADGRTFNMITADTSGNGSLTDEFTAAGNNSTVLISGTINTTAVSVVRTGQTVMGANSATVRSPSGRTAPVTAPAGIINATQAGGTSLGSAVAVGMSSGSTLSGMTINYNATGQIVAVRTDSSNVTVSNNNITVSSDDDSYAIYLSAGNDAVISNNVTQTTTTGSARAGAIIISRPSIITGNSFNVSGRDLSHAIWRAPAGNVNTAASTGNTLTAGASCFQNGGSGSIILTDGSQPCP